MWSTRHTAATQEETCDERKKEGNKTKWNPTKCNEHIPYITKRLSMDTFGMVDPSIKSINYEANALQLISCKRNDRQKKKS